MERGREKRSIREGEGETERRMRHKEQSAAKTYDVPHILQNDIILAWNLY